MKKQRGRFSAKPKPPVFSAADVADAMEASGAEFRFSECGSLFVAGLQKLPEALRELFFNCDGAQLVAYVRSKKTHSHNAVATA